ncbi:MAG: hypothetical protein Q9196_007039 [Gyalolechia fulgens]
MAESVVQVGQRIADDFGVDNRVFLAGDAIHTHSPKVGQGMNVSFQDTYNLGWKVCSVIKGFACPDILNTYNNERRTVALSLLEADRLTTRYYSHPKAAETSKGLPRESLQTFRNRMYAFLSGVSVTYGPNILVPRRTTKQAEAAFQDDIGLSYRHDGSDGQELARRVPLGQRMPSTRVLNHASARPTHIAELLPSTGQWRILIFPGDALMPGRMDQITKLGQTLAQQDSCLRRYCMPSWNPIELYVILCNRRDELPLLKLPDVFHPWDEELGWDYGRVFADERSFAGDGGDAYEKLGIDRSIGCIICCRPDQHVGYIGALEDAVALDEYFGRVFRKAQ